MADVLVERGTGRTPGISRSAHRSRSQIAVPVPLPEGKVGEDVRQELVEWLADAGRRLNAAIAAGVPLGDEAVDEEPADEGEDPGDGHGV